MDDLKSWLLHRTNGTKLQVEKSLEDGLEVVTLKDIENMEAFIIKGRNLNVSWATFKPKIPINWIVATFNAIKRK